MRVRVFFFNDPATTEIYTLSLHDALPISRDGDEAAADARARDRAHRHVAALVELHAHLQRPARAHEPQPAREDLHRSEEHTSELQSRQYLVCRLLLEKKKK